MRPRALRLFVIEPALDPFCKLFPHVSFSPHGPSPCASEYFLEVQYHGIAVILA